MRNCKEVSQVLGERSDQGANTATFDSMSRKLYQWCAWISSSQDTGNTTCPTKHKFTSNYSKQCFTFPSSSTAVHFKAQPHRYCSGEAERLWNSKSWLPSDLCLLVSLMSNKAQTPSDAFPEDGALIKPLARCRLSGTCVVFCLFPLLGHTWGLFPLLAALLHKTCGDIFTVKPFPYLLHLFEVGLKHL